MNKETLVSFRYCFQMILVPCAVFIGVLGNSVSVLVLTRKRMRSSTNIYLTALAIADIMYLLVVFSLSFQHYKNIHHPRYELYWRTYGLQRWFCDAASYTSIYITVSFTIERYIAVCHPIRGQVLCTESKAKKVISVVVILCLLCTCTTPFEHLLSYTPQYVDSKTYEPCTPKPLLNSSTGMIIPVPNCTLPWMTPEKITSPSADHINVTSLPNASQSTTTSAPPPTSLLTASNLVIDATLDGLPSTTTDSDAYEYWNYDYSDYMGDSPHVPSDKAEGLNIDMGPGLEDENLANIIMPFPPVGKIEELPSLGALNNTKITAEASTSISSSLSSLPPASTGTNTQDNCHCLYYLEARSSPLGENETYITVFMWTTCVVFTFIPLILLITFNSFLVLAVKESNKAREKLTNLNSRKVKNKISSISQENKITRTLIAVVILFLICQTPTAIYIVVTTSLPHDLPEETRNVHRVIGNIFNFLITINAASNFVLYCVLSEKYRQTVKELIMGRKHIRQATLKSFYLSRHGTISESLYSNHFNPSRPKPPPPAPSAPPLRSIPTDPNISAGTAANNGRGISVSRQSSTRSDRSVNGKPYQGRNSFHNEPIPENRESDPVASGLNRKLSYTPSVHGNAELANNRLLKSSGSTSSLTRSQSVILEQKIRHSPGCKKYNNL